jgi:hypothetical protein
MRSDHLDIYEQSSDALQAPFFQPWRLGPFPPERIKDVIRKPVNRARLEITDVLVERLKRDTPTAEALPLLAFTLEKLYRGCASHGKLELQDYVSLGGMEGSIQTCAECIVPPNSLSTSDAAVLRLAFVKHLAQANDKGEVVRLTARWDDLPAAAKPILEKFVNERLLTRSESKVTEVAHEAMFRCWKDLKEWLHTSADILRWRRDVRRDQGNDPKWTGLRPAQLAVARDWPKKRREELTAEEVKWIKRGIRSERIRGGIVATVVLVVSLLAGIAWWQRNQADNATRAAQNALTGSFFRTIGVSNEKIPTQDGREALWELAQLNPTNAAVRDDLLNRWFRTVGAFMRGEARGGQGFRAVIGLNLEYHRRANRGAADLGRGVAATMEDPKQTALLLSLADALTKLAARMEPHAAADIAQRLAAAMEDPKQTDLYRLLDLAHALAALAARMEPHAAAEVARLGAQRQARALEDPTQTDLPNLPSLADALAALAARLEPPAAAEVARRGAKRLAGAI